MKLITWNELTLTLCETCARAHLHDAAVRKCGGCARDMCPACGPVLADAWLCRECEVALQELEERDARAQASAELPPVRVRDEETTLRVLSKLDRIARSLGGAL